MQKSVSEKIGVKKGMLVLLVDAPDKFSEQIDMPEVRTESASSGVFDYIHFFVVTQKDFLKRFPVLKEHLKPGGMLWVSWPKSGQKASDLTIKNIIKMGYDAGLVESKAISVDPVWSGLKFTFPKKGKEYHNSYGQLKQ